MRRRRDETKLRAADRSGPSSKRRFDRTKRGRCQHWAAPSSTFLHSVEGRVSSLRKEDAAVRKIAGRVWQSPLADLEKSSQHLGHIIACLGKGGTPACLRHRSFARLYPASTSIGSAVKFAHQPMQGISPARDVSASGPCCQITPKTRRRIRHQTAFKPLRPCPADGISTPGGFHSDSPPAPKRRDLACRW